jgi:prepilin-type N-terminal cleavage/methylation domain-containing protein
VSRRAGFTLIEIAVALVVVSLLMLIGLPKFTSAMTKNDVRGARTTVVNLLARARAASTGSGRVTWLKMAGNQAWITATPRRNLPIGANTIDTLGIVENLNTRYGISLSSTVDSIMFDPRGIASEIGTGATIKVSKYGHADTVAVNGMGRVIK